jgi:hypothetical protein
MCTVTFVPAKDGYFLGSNRDEQATRATAIAPVYKHNLLFPQDADKGGTWLAITDSGDCLCLLNGAFTKHQFSEKYTLSRGLVVLDIAQQQQKIEYISQLDLSNVEPFTLVLHEAKLLYEIKWDGLAKHIRQLDNNKAHVWSSCTLYDEPIQNLRQDWFQTFLDAGITAADDLLKFHQQAGNGIASQNVLMQREHVGTVSTSIVSVNKQGAKLKYIDYKLGTQQTQEINIVNHHS